ncbi:MAG: anaerobic sulfatase maturase [Methanoregulaceae archaeon]|nr:anaerobic sulfatase maturase [Methanoregulaceae archaeon]
MSSCNLPAFHLMAKPAGSRCNLACQYCFYLHKGELYPKSRFRMSEEVLEAYIRQTIEAHCIPEVTFAWQGGEPTLLGRDFFEKAILLQKKYCRPGMVIHNTIQTNGILLDDAWCDFFRKNRFLVGISIDGPRELHDACRTDAGGKGTFNRVMLGLALLKKHKVDFNILCTVNAVNGDHPLEVYRFFRDEVKAQFIQFIPVVERDLHSNTVTPLSVSPEQYGKFLIGVFDEWVRHDVGRIYVQHFDTALANWYGEPHGICVFSPTCGSALVIEHNGDIYSCDHFVDRDHLLGNILEVPIIELVNNDRQRQFGRNKTEKLPKYCLECPVLFACRGECPKNRFVVTPDGEPGLNYLCEGYRMFFSHIQKPMKFMVQELTASRPPSNVMKYMVG